MQERTRVLVALCAAAAIGAIIARSGSPAAVHAADALTPLGVLWVNAIRMTVIPLVTSLIITGVASVADIGAIGRMGARTLVVFVALLTMLAVVITPLAPAAFSLLGEGARPSLPSGAAEAARDLVSAGQPQTIGTWIASLLPGNALGAAANGAMVPFILFVLATAIAIARSAEETRTTMLAFFRALGDTMMTLVKGVIWCAPVGVFALVLPLAAHAGASLAGAIGFYILAYSAACLLSTAALYPAVRFAAGVPMRTFARAALAPQLIALSSSSSLASLPALVRAAETDLGLRKEVTGFVLPLAAAMFKVGGPVSWTVGTLFVAWFYNVPLHLPQVAMVAFAGVVLGFATPGIPRGAFISMTPILVALGLPVEGLGILIAVDAIPDVFATVLNVTGSLAATAIVARRTAPA